MSPMAGFPDFEACVLAQTKDGKSKESADKICGAIKAKVEGDTQKFDLSDDEQFAVDSFIKKFSDEVKIYENIDSVEIFSVGTWNKDKYNQSNLQEMVSNFDALKDIVKPPAKLGHSEDQSLLKKEGLPAAGWVDKLKMVGNKVVASFTDVPKVVKDLIDKKAYKRVSAEIYPKYKDPRNGKIYNNVLRAVAFLGQDIPAVETLSDITALGYSSKDTNGIEFRSYSIDIEQFNNKQLGGEKQIMGKLKVSIEGMEEATLIKKLSDALGEGVKVNVVSDPATDINAGLTPEEIKKKEDEALATAKDKEIKAKKIEELTQQYEAVTKLQVEKDSTIADLTKKLAEMQTMLDQMKQQMGTKETEGASMMAELATLKKNTKSEAIKSFVKQAASEGKILPKDENIIVALMEQLDDKAVVKFTQDSKETSESMVDIIKKFITNLPKAVEFKELAPNVEHKVYDNKVSIGGVNYEVQDIELVQKAEKYAQDNKVAFDVALIEVSKQ